MRRDLAAPFGNNRRPMGLQGERLARIGAIFR
jgi:hypothetical protein